MFAALDIGASGLTAQRIRMDTIAGNVANMNSTHENYDADGKAIPYQRRIVNFMARQKNGKAGVSVENVSLDQAPFKTKIEPGHQDADPITGIVRYPNVDLMFEMVNMIEASRAYEANVTMMETTKSMLNSSLRLLA